MVSILPKMAAAMRLLGEEAIRRRGEKARVPSIVTKATPRLAPEETPKI
jgi:hypothetical protein